MTKLEIRPVKTRRENETFLTFPWRIYRSDPLWVPPLLPERRKVVDPQTGPFFQRGEAEFFIAWRGSEPVGTICCAEDKAAHAAHPWRDAVFGFFECYNEEAIAEALFEHAAAWARARDLDALYGPFNLDYEDGYGVLVEGRDRPPVILCGHTPEYYLDLFARFGFEPGRADNLAFGVELDLTAASIRRLLQIADRVRARGHFRVRGADLSKWKAEVDLVYGVINRALKHLPGHIPWRREALQALMAPFVQIVDPELVLFVEAVDTGDVVGFFPGIPNVNEAFIHVNGLRFPWNYLQLLVHMRRQPECLSVKSVLVPPEYWDTGVAVLMFAEMAQRAAARGYRWIDLSLTSDDNPRTPRLATRMGAQIYKRYRVFRKWLNPAAAHTSTANTS